MNKKKVIIASGIAAAAVVVGVGSMYYVKHNQKQDTHPDSIALSKEEATELLENAFANMDSADISMNSTVHWTTGSAATVGDGVENMDADSSAAEEQTSEIAGEQTSDTYDESTLSATAQFSGKNAHGQWTSQYTSNAMTDAAASENTDGEFYLSEANGAITGYVKTSADTIWVKKDNVENAVSGPDYMKNFTYGTYGKLENVEADKNKDGSYIIHADMSYADATQAAGLVTGNIVSISDDDFSGASTAVEILIDKDKKVTSLLMVTDNTEKTDANADGKIAESNNISITFNQNDDVTASLLNEGTRQSIENEIQAAADAAAAEAAQEQENATVEENTDNNTAVSSSNNGSSSSSSNSGSSSSGGSSSKKSSSSRSKSSNSESGSSSSDAGSGNYVYGQDTPGVESTITIGDDRPSDYGQTPSNATDSNQVGNGSWESEGKPDYVDKEFAGGYVPDDYTPGHE